MGLFPTAIAVFCPIFILYNQACHDHCHCQQNVFVGTVPATSIKQLFLTVRQNIRRYLKCAGFIPILPKVTGSTSCNLSLQAKESSWAGPEVRPRIRIAALPRSSVGSPPPPPPAVRWTSGHLPCQPHPRCPPPGQESRRWQRLARRRPCHQNRSPLGEIRSSLALQPPAESELQGTRDVPYRNLS